MDEFNVQECPICGVIIMDEFNYRCSSTIHTYFEKTM